MASYNLDVNPMQKQ